MDAKVGYALVTDKSLLQRFLRFLVRSNQYPAKFYSIVQRWQPLTLENQDGDSCKIPGFKTVAQKQIYDVTVGLHMVQICLHM